MYQEEQKARIWWISLIIAAVALFAWIQFIQQIVRDKPFGENPGPDWSSWFILILVGILLPLLFWRMAMETTVDQTGITVRWRPFATRTISPDQIASWQSRHYRPVREFGGWGIKGWGNKRAYNVSGDRGVELMLVNGQHLLIGSQHPEELANAIAALKEQQSS